MNAGTKYLFDSLMGLMMEVATLRTLKEEHEARIAALEKELAPYKASANAQAPGDPNQMAANSVQAANVVNMRESTATFDDFGQATP